MSKYHQNITVASSTDAERVFSEGWQEVNFTQHNMSSQTFKVDMAVGSWDGTPLFPDPQAAFSITEKKISGQAQLWVTAYISRIALFSGIVSLFCAAMCPCSHPFVYQYTQTWFLRYLHSGEHSTFGVTRRWFIFCHVYVISISQHHLDSKQSQIVGNCKLH